jgi:PPOX class probable F420-dependent enzyme
MPEPTVPADYRDLLDADFAALATKAPDGKIQVTAVAFLYDETDGYVKISLNDTRQKTRNLRRDPTATLFVVDPKNPFRTLEIRGTAELTPDPDFAFAATAGAKYGQDFHRHDNPGETRSVVTLRPTRIVAQVQG